MEKIIDYISGIQIDAKPEEVEATQPFSKQLVNDYGYPKEFIQTRPQFHVKCRPSDMTKEYPVDIAIFTSPDHNDDTINIIVECKRNSREDGRTELEDYLRLSKAVFGVWYNGNERFFIHKIEKDGRVYFEDIPNIPKYGQRLEDIGQYERKNLTVPHNLKSVFRAIRNSLFANTVGATRDEVLAAQLINLIFCKIYDEKYTKPNDVVSFRCGVGENHKDVAKRIKAIFEKVKMAYADVIEAGDTITLDDDSIAYVVGELQNYCLMDASRDAIGDAFEVFIGHALKGGQGQFFTPRNIIQMMVKILHPNRKELIIDPACGSGGFLVESLKYIWDSVDNEAKQYEWSPEVTLDEKKDVSYNCIRGIDKDSFLAKTCKAYMAVMGDGRSGIFCEDSLEETSKWHARTQQKIQLGIFDAVLTNPPFGSKIPVKGEQKLRQYDLGYKWKKDNTTGRYQKDKLKPKEAPQILFIERCIQLLKKDGRMAIVLPDGCFGNESLSYVRQWLLDKVQVVGVIDIPLETFLPNTGTKTSILLCKKVSEEELKKDYPVFMCIAETCGHDRRGNEIKEDDILDVPEKFEAWKKETGVDF